MKKIFIASMSAELGGIEKSMITFLQYLVTLPNYEITLMLWKKRGALLSSIPKEVRIIDAPTPGSLRKILKSFNLLRLLTYIKLKYYTRRNKPWEAFPFLQNHYDIAIAYSQDGYSPYYIIDKVYAERKYMWFHHGAYLHSGVQKKIDQLYYPKFTSVIPVSESIKDVLLKELTEVDINYTVIPNLLNVEEIITQSQEFCPEFDNVKCLKLVTVGRLSYEKGQIRALDVAKKLIEKGVGFKWIFVGDGPDKDICLKKVNELNLADYVSFIGSRTNPYPYIRYADIYVAPSYVEADPVTIQEALILKKNIIGSNINAISEALENGKYGILCSNDNIDSYVNNIISKAINIDTYPIFLKNVTITYRNSMVKAKLMNLFGLKKNV